MYNTERYRPTYDRKLGMPIFLTRRIWSLILEAAVFATRSRAQLTPELRARIQASLRPSVA